MFMPGDLMHEYQLNPYYPAALMEGPQQGRATKHEQAATIRCHWSAHRTSWPKWSFI